MVILAVFLALIFLFSLVSRRAQESSLTGPMVFVLAGILVNIFVPELSQVEVKNHTILVIGEITLAVVLFSDATRLSFRRVMRETQIPARMLGIGMPLSILAGTLIAKLLVPELSIWEAAILGTILAPTDASLGAAVVNSKLVPDRIRNTLSVESGLNDGLSMPFLMLFIALTGVTAHGQEQSWLVYTAQQIGFGLLVGVVLGWLGGWLMDRAEQHGWTERAAKQLGLLSLAVLAWFVADKVVAGNGFIAAFVAGSMVRLAYEDAGQHMGEFDEAWGDLLVYLVFFFFGMLVAPKVGGIGAMLWVYALLSLTLVRMLPVAVSLIGVRLQRASVLFLGWFGPRGLASVVLGMIYIEELEEFSANPMIVLAVMATVLLSVLAHGVSAKPSTKWYARKVAVLDADAPEFSGGVPDDE